MKLFIQGNFFWLKIGEDRLYQEVTSIDELYVTIEGCLDEYNQTHKPQMDLVIFRYDIYYA